MRALMAVLFLIGSGSDALAMLKVCNKFKHPIHLAAATQPSTAGCHTAGPRSNPTLVRLIPSSQT